MRLMIFVLLLGWLALAGAESSQWRHVSNGVFATKTLEGKLFYLTAHNDTETGQISFNFRNDESKDCENLPSYATKDLGRKVYKINGTLVSFMSICVGKYPLEYPASDAGKSFLANAVSTSDKLVMVVGTGDRITFNLAGFTEVQKVLTEMRSAL